MSESHSFILTAVCPDAVGIVAAEVLLYVAAVKTFPILASSRPAGRA